MGGTGVSGHASDRDRPITVVVCDDHRVLTDTLALAIQNDPAFALAAPPLDSPEQAVEACRTHRPDVALMDLAFDGRMDGLEAIARIREAAPDTAIVVMTAYRDERFLVEAAAAGAAGFLLKTDGLQAVLEAARAAATGSVVMDRDRLETGRAQVEQDAAAAEDARVRLSRLTARESEVLRLLSEGVRGPEIARRLFISEQTVQTHVRNILSKLGVRSRLEAVLLAAKYGDRPTSDPEAEVSRRE